MPIDVTLTVAEQKAIKSLNRLEKKWPRSLQLFSWSGSLYVFKKGHQGNNCVVGHASGIPSDGGDPDSGENINQSPEIHYE